ncbi:hypothetical protein SDC9_210913 [bioreactor metagenome]|uniref:Uncharacterized protein n=1 Tax=bioreactor metagenome TaxID=1076179 RepID=A0A645JKB3_9ZZZZ
MDHQVQNHTHFGASAVHTGTRRRIFRQPVRFDEKRVGTVLFQEVHRRVEPFHVTDAEDNIFLFRRANHLPGFRDRGGQRFFHQQMLAHLDQRHGS